MSTPTSKARIAIIGISGYGRIHLQLARESMDRGEIEITAVTVINPQEEADNVAELKQRGVEIFKDYGMMLRQHAGRIDLCLIPTGIHWHARMTIAALESGANVLVEKPLAASVAEVEEIQRTERRTGRFVAVGFQDFSDPGTAWLKTQLAGGVIGLIREVRFLGVWPRPRSYYTRNNWAGRLQVDGRPVMDSPLSNAFAHFVMLGLFFADGGEIEVEDVKLLRAHAIESFDSAMVTARTRGGVRLWFGASHACAVGIEPEVKIIGENGCAFWRYESLVGWTATGGKFASRSLLDIDGARRAMLAAAVGRMNGGNEPLCTSEFAGWHTALIGSIHREGVITTAPAAEITWTGKGEASEQVPDICGLSPAMWRIYQSEQSFMNDARAKSQ